MNSQLTINNPNKGVIRVSYSFSMDGEYFSGINEYNVIVTEWWKTGYLKNTAKEVKTANYLYYRYTKQNGWRKYDKIYKKFEENRYTGKSIKFVPDIQDSSGH